MPAYVISIIAYMYTCSLAEGLLPRGALPPAPPGDVPATGPATSSPVAQASKLPSLFPVGAMVCVCVCV